MTSSVPTGEAAPTSLRLPAGTASKLTRANSKTSSAAAVSAISSRRYSAEAEAQVEQGARKLEDRRVLGRGTRKPRCRYRSRTRIEAEFTASRCKPGKHVRPAEGRAISEGVSARRVEAAARS